MTKLYLLDKTAKRNKKWSTGSLQCLRNGSCWYIISIYLHVQISQKSPIMEILARCQFCLLTHGWSSQKWCLACGDVEKRIWEHQNDFLSTCPKPFSWAKNRRRIFFDGKSRGALIAFIWDHDREKRGNDQVELLIVKQILLVSSLWNV